MAILSAALLVAGCGGAGSDPGSDPPAAAASVPANVDCSGPSAWGSERGVDIGGKRTIKGQKGASDQVSGIVAHGTCKIVGVPDTAMLSAAVRVQAPTVRLAVDGVNGKADAAFGILTSKGVMPAEIHTGDMQVVPVGSPLLRSATGIGGVQITGYAATRTLTATLHDLTTAGPTISLITDSTGDSGEVEVSYYVADDRALREQARTAAIQQAQANARQLAADSGVALGDLASVAEIGDATDPTRAGMYEESVDMVYAVDG
jgi:hypothetical protein